MQQRRTPDRSTRLLTFWNRFILKPASRRRSSSSRAARFIRCWSRMARMLSRAWSRGAFPLRRMASLVGEHACTRAHAHTHTHKHPHTHTHTHTRTQAHHNREGTESETRVNRPPACGWARTHVPHAVHRLQDRAHATARGVARSDASTLHGANKLWWLHASKYDAREQTNYLQGAGGETHGCELLCVEVESRKNEETPKFVMFR